MFFKAFRKFPVLSQHFICGPSARIARSLRQISFFAKFFKRKPPAIKCDIVKDKKGSKCVCTPYDFTKPPSKPRAENDKISPETFLPLQYKGEDPVTHHHNRPLPMANYQEIFGTKQSGLQPEISIRDVINRKEKSRVVLDPDSGKAEVRADDDDCEKKLEEVVDLSEFRDKNDNFCPKPPPPKVEEEKDCDKMVGVKEETALMENVAQEEACQLVVAKGEDVEKDLCEKLSEVEKSCDESSKVETCPVKNADGKEDCCKDVGVIEEDCVRREEEDLIQLPECVLNSNSVLCKKATDGCPPKKVPEKKKCKKESDVFFHRETVCLPDCEPKPEKCKVEKKPIKCKEEKKSAKCKEKKPVKCQEEKKPIVCEEKTKPVDCEEEKKPIRCDDDKKVKSKKKKKKASGSCASNDPYCCVKKPPKCDSNDTDRLKFISLQHFWRQQEKKIPKNCSKFVSAPTRSLVDHILRKQIGGRLFQNSKYLEVFCRASFSECGRCGSPKFEPDARRRKRRYEFFDSNDSGGQCNRCRKYEALESDECARCAKYEVYKDVENGIRKKDLVEEEDEMPKKEICEEVCKEKIVPGTCIKPSDGQEDWNDLRTFPVKEIVKPLTPPDMKKVAVSKECIRKKILTVLKKAPKPKQPICPKPGAKKRFQLKKEVFKLKPPPEKKNYLQEHLVQPKKIGRFFSNKLQESAEPKLNSCKPAEKPVKESKRRAAGYLNPPTPQPDPDDVRNEVCRRSQPPCRKK